MKKSVKSYVLWFVIIAFSSYVFSLVMRMPSTIAVQKQKRFTLLNPSSTGIDFNNKIKDTKEQNILLYANFYGGAGVGVGDFNNDGLQDLYFAGNMVPDKLYLNQGNLTFKDVTESSGIIDDGGWSTGVTIADINNDGFSDIYVSRELYDNKPEWRTNLLYINKGDGTFTESAKIFGVNDSQRTRHATFLDYDKDGFLDLFLLTQPPNPGGYSEFSGTTLLKPEYHLKLFKNTGKNAFIDVSEQAGIKRTGFPNGVSASDINNDGWTDLYVTNDFYAPDFLFINNQDGTFTNSIHLAVNHMPYYSMGVDVADINNDALLDIFVVDMVAEDNFRSKSNMSGMNPERFWEVVDDGGHYQYMYNAVQLNNGNTTFSDVAQLTGMAATDWSWSNLIADFNNDGLKDTYITNGLLYDIRNTDADRNVAKFIDEKRYDWLQKHPDGGNINSVFDILNLEEVIALIPSQPLKNYAFKNNGDLKFQKVMEEWGLNEESFSNGSAYADLDNDGDLDIVVNNINSEAFVYRNNSENIANSNFLRVQLVDDKHRPVLGTRVNLYSGNETQTYETTNVRGIYSTSEPFVHFGLNKSTKVDSVVVTWPNQMKTVKRNLTVNQTVQIAMNDASNEFRKLSNKKESSFFSDSTASFDINFKHKENTFDDYQYQVLLPHKLSQMGPAMAKGDVNNDGLDDVYLGGATGHSAHLYIQNVDGSFSRSNTSFWKKESPYEDVDALFVDINNDGYQDLYVVSGGNEYPVNDLHYVDRLYLNDCKGNFSKGAIINVSRDSGSIVKASDYDNDGDMDLFVGGRHLPHQYPLPTNSMLLKNENGQLINATQTLASEFKNIGMVTDAVWNDFDGDGDLDLTIVGEWMPITFFKNDEGVFSKVVVDGLEDSSGWWFSLEKGDFDKDGDMDFIAGNLGLNYKYKTTKENPFDIYYNDFDANGNNDIVLGYYSDNKHYPLRGFSCSSQQIPALKEKIGKYDVFASLEIDQVYGIDNLQKSLHYKATTFASSYIENLGNGRFKVSSLPYQAQFSNINDILVDDFNKDGHLDALTVGNMFVSEIETPRNDAGNGLLMLGDGKGNFSASTNKESGFFANRDAKKIVVISNKKQRKILIANNDDKLQCFNIKEE
jgi:enediyne biosynthesis protein E4